MVANLVNVTVVIIVAIIGSRLNKWFKESIADELMKAVGLFILYLGITGLSSKTSPIALLISIFLGATIGSFLDLDDKINRFGEFIQKTLSKGKNSDVTKSMVAFFIASCSGAYTIVACFNAGAGNSSMLWTKVIIDLVAGLAMATSMGIGVALSAIPIFLYQTVLIISSGFLFPLMNEAMLDILGCIGGLFTMALGLNLMGICKFRIANYIPAMLIAPFIVLLF